MIEQSRYSNFWMGFIVTITVVMAVLYAMREDVFDRIGKSRQAAKARVENPNPPTLDEYCAGADPDVTSGELFHHPRQNLGHRICMSGSIAMTLSEDRYGDYYYHIRSNAWLLVLTLDGPENGPKMFGLQDFVRCGGEEVEGLEGDPFDYLPRLECRFLWDVNSEVADPFPVLTETLVGRGWRKAIVKGRGEDRFEIWRDENDHYFLEIYGMTGAFQDAVLRFEHPADRGDDDEWEEPFDVGRFIITALSEMGESADAREWFMSSMIKLESMKEGALDYSLAGYYVSLEKKGRDFKFFIEPR